MKMFQAIIVVVFFTILFVLGKTLDLFPNIPWWAGLIPLSIIYIFITICIFSIVIYDKIMSKKEVKK